jgi:hypothetical protein
MTPCERVRLSAYFRPGTQPIRQETSRIYGSLFGMCTAPSRQPTSHLRLLRRPYQGKSIGRVTPNGPVLIWIEGSAPNWHRATLASVQDSRGALTEQLSSPTETGEDVDLRTFFRSVGGPKDHSGLTTPPAPRPMWDGPVAQGAGQPRPVAKFGSDPVWFTDGCQAAAVAAYVGSPKRPVLLLWAAATAIEPTCKGAGASGQRLWLSCSAPDVPWARELPGGLQVVPVASLWSRGIRCDALEMLRSVRSELEVAVINGSDPGDAPFLIDGSLLNLGPNPVAGRIGVVKTLGTRYLADERPLAELPEGNRSATFELLPRTVTETRRFSCYLRLRPPQGDDWGHGLIRLEAYSEEDLERGGSAAFSWRQPAGVSDPRWDTQLDGTRIVELILRDRKPFPL